MANDKETRLSIVIRTVDQATARIKAINERLDKITKPMRDFKKALGELKEKSGLDAVIAGFKGVGSAITNVLGKATMIGGVIGAAVIGIKSLIDEFDDLGDKAEHIGVGVDFLAQMRYAAQRSGVQVEQLDAGLKNFSKSLGQARAGTGKMAGFLSKVSPALLKQLKGAKSNEAAFDLLANAMAKLEDPAKRAALAAATVGDPELATMLAKGSFELGNLRSRFGELAGPMDGAVAASGEFGDSMDDLKAATQGIKAALVTGLAPALKIIVDRLREWFVANRDRIAEWAKDIGERLPGAVANIVAWVKEAVEKVGAFIDKIGGLKTVAIAAAAIIAGPLITSVLSLTTALVTAISRAGQLGGALRGIGGAGGLGGAALGPVCVAAGAVFAAKSVADYMGREGVENKGGIGSLGSDVMTKGNTANLQFLRGLANRGTQSASLSESVSRSMEGVRSADAQQAKVTVDFANAPRGTRASVDPQSSADVDLSVGYNMLPGGAL